MRILNNTLMTSSLFDDVIFISNRVVSIQVMTSCIALCKNDVVTLQNNSSIFSIIVISFIGNILYAILENC